LLGGVQLELLLFTQVGFCDGLRQVGGFLGALRLDADRDDIGGTLAGNRDGLGKRRHHLGGSSFGRVAGRLLGEFRVFRQLEFGDHGFQHGGGGNDQKLGIEAEHFAAEQRRRILVLEGLSARRVDDDARPGGVDRRGGKDIGGGETHGHDRDERDERQALIQLARDRPGVDQPFAISVFHGGVRHRPARLK
jgi:hypothetical protein